MILVSVHPIKNVNIPKYIVPPTVSCSVLIIIRVVLPPLQSMQTLLSPSNAQDSIHVLLLISLHHPIPIWISRVLTGTLALHLQSLLDLIPLSIWYAPMATMHAGHPIFQLEPIALSM